MNGWGTQIDRAVAEYDTHFPGAIKALNDVGHIYDEKPYVSKILFENHLARLKTDDATGLDREIKALFVELMVCWEYAANARLQSCQSNLGKYQAIVEPVRHYPAVAKVAQTFAACSTTFNTHSPVIRTFGYKQQPASAHTGIWLDAYKDVKAAYDGLAGLETTLLTGLEAAEKEIEARKKADREARTFRRWWITTAIAVVGMFGLGVASSGEIKQIPPVKAAITKIEKLLGIPLAPDTKPPPDPHSPPPQNPPGSP